MIYDIITYSNNAVLNCYCGSNASVLYIIASSYMCCFNRAIPPTMTSGIATPDFVIGMLLGIAK